jgi:site-specific DNA recombinase
MDQRVALYARVSTARQEQERTIESQIEAIEKSAAATGLRIDADRRYIDEGFSGSRLDRPALDALRDAAADGLLDRVFIYCPDRLARSYVHQQVVLEELQKRAVQVSFVERPVGERPEDRLLVQMQGVIAEYERAKIIERTRRGRLHKVRTGQMLPYSAAPPYGYAVVRSPGANALLVINEVEAHTVRAMYRWVLDEGLSTRQVAKRLNSMAIRPRRAKVWTASVVSTVLKNPAYTGTAVYGRCEPAEPKRPRKPGTYRKNAKSSYVVRPQAQWIHVPIPALITLQDQEAVRARLAKNKFVSKRNVKHEYLLRTLAVCGECGRKMSCTSKHGRRKRYEYSYYGCERLDPVDTGRVTPCNGGRIQAGELDKVVWDAVTTWIQSPQMLQQEIVAWQSSRAAAAGLADELAKLDGALRHLTQQMERLLDAYQHGAMQVEELRARRERIDASISAAKLRREELSAQKMDSTRLDKLSTDLMAFANSLRDGLGTLDFAGRQRLVQLLIERVVVTGEKLTIEHAIPLSGRFCHLRQREVGEVQNESVVERDGVEIRPNNGEVDVLDGFDGLELDDELIVHNEVQSVKANFDAAIGDRHGELSLECETAGLQLDAKSVFVDLFDEAWAQGSVDGDGRADNVFTQRLMLKFHPATYPFLDSWVPARSFCLFLGHAIFPTELALRWMMLLRYRDDSPQTSAAILRRRRVVWRLGARAGDVDGSGATQG